MAIPAPTSDADAMWTMNLKAIADSGASLIMGAAQDVKLSQARLAILGENLLARAGTTLVQPDPIEAAATKQILTGNAMGDNALVTALAAILSKVSYGFPNPIPAGGTS